MEGKAPELSDNQLSGHKVFHCLLCQVYRFRLFMTWEIKEENLASKACGGAEPDTDASIGGPFQIPGISLIFQIRSSRPDRKHGKSILTKHILNKENENRQIGRRPQNTNLLETKGLNWLYSAVWPFSRAFQRGTMEGPQLEGSSP